jgi:hypothetical protein
VCNNDVNDMSATFIPHGSQAEQIINDEIAAGERRYSQQIHEQEDAPLDPATEVTDPE